MRLALGLPASLFLATTFAPDDAVACGGFFCMQRPVVQTAERIVFEIEGDEVSAYIQLSFRGDDPDFAWIIPVPTVPEVDVEIGQELFDSLETQTRPEFVLPASSSAIAPEIGPSGCGFSGGGGSTPGRSRGPPTLSVRAVSIPEVDVWARENVGPYEVTTVSAAHAGDLNIWLRLNGYRIDPSANPIVQTYLDEGFKLLALKLRPELGSSQIRPIRLKYIASRGCAAIPLRLTTIAADPDLEIVAWIFGSGRAVPENFAAIEIDPSTLAGERDYLPALKREIDRQGDGRGFVTEFAAPTARIDVRGDPTLATLVDRHTWVTRVRTFVDPAEMTADPAFLVDGTAPEVSNRIVLGGGSAAAGAPLGAVVFLLALSLLRGRRR